MPCEARATVLFMVSFIIPIYNAAHYLEECLLSINKQTFDDWECLLIDDGSTDNSSIICDEWCQKDCRFKAFHMSNIGASAARNIGLSESKGELICFVDADDWIDEDYLEYLTKAPIDADWIVSGQIREYEDGSSKVLMPKTALSYTICQENASPIVALESKSLLYAPHEKIYKSDIIKKYNLRFPENCSYGEDLIFNYRYLDHVRTIKTLAFAKYHYRMHKGSLSSAFRPDQFVQDYSQWLILKDFHEKNALWNKEVEDYLAKRLWGIVYDGVFLFPELKNPEVNYLSEVLSIPEIDFLKHHQNVFESTKWIKFAIVNRWSVLFKLVFLISKPKYRKNGPPVHCRSLF